MRLALEPLGRQVDEHDAARHAAVEQHGQRDVAAGPAVPADQLHGDGAERRRRPPPSSTGLRGQQEAERDAGQRHVADAVAHQRQPPLHQVDADGGGGDADQDSAASRARCMKA